MQPEFNFYPAILFFASVIAIVLILYITNVVHAANGLQVDTFKEKSDVINRHPLLRRLLDFFFVPVKADLLIPDLEDPELFRNVERSFTTILRFSSLISPIVTLLSGPEFANFRTGYIAFLIIELLLALLAIVRAIPFKIRAVGSIAVFFAFGVVEIISFGYSAESFLFFTIVVVGAAMVMGRKHEWLIVLFVTLATLGVFGWLIVQGLFVPLAADQALIASSRYLRPFPMLISFTAVTAGLSIAITTMWISLSRTWQSEKAAKELYQQERDLLDVRVRERSLALAESEARYRGLVEQVPVVVYTDIADGEGTNLYMSPQIESLLGYSMDAWKANSDFWRTVLYPEDREYAIATVREVLDRGYSQAEYRMLAQDGHLVWVRDEATLIFDEAGRPKFIQGILQDISEHKQVEQELRESEEKYRLITHNAEDIIWIMNMNLQITYVSPSLERALGCSANEILSSSVDQLVTEESLARGLQAFNEEIAIATVGDFSRPSRVLELEYRRKDATTFWAEMKFNFFWDAIENPVGVMGVGRDITHRKQAEEGLKQYAENMVILTQISQEILTTFDLERVYQEVHATVQKLMPCDVFVISLLDEAKQEIEDVYLWDGGIRYPNQRYPAGQGLSNHIIKSGTPLRINMWNETHDYMTNASTFGDMDKEPKSVLAVPFLDGKRQRFGMISTQSYKQDSYTIEHEQLLITLASQVAKAIENVRLFNELEQELGMRKQAENKFRALLEAAPDAILVIDEQAKIVIANSQVEKQFGYLRHELIGQTIEIIVPENFRFMHPKHRSAYVKSPHVRQMGAGLELTACRKDGSEFPVDISLSPLETEEGDLIIASVRDITDRKQAEEALQEKAAQIQAISDGLSNGYLYQIDFGLHGELRQFNYISAGVEKIYGVSVQEALEDSTKLDERVPEEDRNKIAELESQAFASMKPFRAEIRVGYGKDKRWLFLNSMPRELDNGHIVWDGIASDITQLKHVQEELQKSEEKYRTIFENVEDVFYTTDYRGHILSISPSIERRSGFRPDQVIGQHVRNFFVNQQDYDKLDFEVSTMGFLNDYEMVMKRVDSGTIYVSATARVILDKDGNPVGTEGTLRDITARKEAEERIKQLNSDLEQRVARRTQELQSTNSFLSSLLTTTLAINSSLDQDEVLSHILSQALALVRCRSLNIMLIQGESVYVARRIGYDGLDDVMASQGALQFSLSWPTFTKIRRTGTHLSIADTNQESDWFQTQGMEWIRSYVGVPLKVGGDILGFLNANDDQPDFFNKGHINVLEGFAQHAAVAIQNSRLLNELKEALDKEQSMRAQLVQADKLASLGKMVAVIAHEINNPIQTIMNTFFLLEDQVKNTPAQNYLQIAKAETSRISDLVSQLRETYQPRSKTFTRVNLLDLVTEVRIILTPQLKKSKVTWVQPDSFHSCIVFGVRNNLKQVFINLAQNAIEAMEPDDKGKIDITLRTDPDFQRVGIAFHNTGPLIPEKNLTQIFDPFFTTKGNGTGLGLYISYDIVHQHQGEIVVESNIEKGVVFTIWLPLAPDGR